MIKKEMLEKIDRDIEADCPAGWWNTVKAAARKMLYHGWDGNTRQIKSKFGSLRWYFNDGTPKNILDIALFTEGLTYYMCEDCGRPTNGPSSDGSWVVNKCGLSSCGGN